MKTLIQIVMVALIVGGVSAGGSFYWHIKMAKSAVSATEASKDSEDEPAGEDGEASEVTETDAQMAESNAEHTEVSNPAVKAPGPDDHTVASADANHGQGDVLAELQPFGPPAGVRPPFDQDGDEAGDLINRLRSRAIFKARQERSLGEREDAMKLIIDDLRAEQANAGKMRKRILAETSKTMKDAAEVRRSSEADRAAIYRAAQDDRAKMLQDQKEERKLADEQIARMFREKEEAVEAAQLALKAAREEQEDLRRQIEAIKNPPPPEDHSGSPEETANLKDTVKRIDSMPAENTAEILQELVKKGRTEAVVAILNGMKPRQCASVLSLIAESKPSLAADLIDGMKRLKKETPPAPAAAGN